MYQLVRRGLRSLVRLVGRVDVCVSITLVAGLVASIGFLAPAPVATAAASHSEIEGDGSSWAANAVQQWVSDVAQSSGLQVVFTSTGSAQGRTDFGNSSVDFAVSDIGYQGTDPLTGQADSTTRGYAYLPIVAGGTAFPYQIKVGGQLVKNLRLSGQTLAKIFTNQITNWADPQITADNNGRQLPSIPIIPVVHSEGSGSSAQLSTFLDTDYTSIWRGFAGGSGPAGHDFTEYFPAKGNAVAENGSDNVQNFISAGGSNGAIGYDEYSYALGQNWPVAKVENAAGYFTLPSQYDVAVALTQAQIDPTTLLQTLTNVYTYNDPRTYPLSSYSYGIIPTSPTDPKMTTSKRQTLVDYLYYGICGGQKEIGPIGYSSLPLNLVQASFQRIDLLKTADPNVDITQRDPTTCNNPTFDPSNPSLNLLAQIAPQPPACDQSGQGPCDASGVNPEASPTAGGSGSDSGGGSSSGGTATGPSGTSGPTGPTGSTGPQAGPSPTGAAAKGSTSKGSSSTGGHGTGSSSSQVALGGVAGVGNSYAQSTTDTATPSPSLTNLADGPPRPTPRDSKVGYLVPLAILLLLLVVAAPPIIVIVADRHRKGDA